jgi:hypothetical protein
MSWMLVISENEAEIFWAIPLAISAKVDIQAEICAKTPFLMEECPFCAKGPNIF